MSWGFLDYVPGVSNVKGAISGDTRQMTFGAGGKILDTALGKQGAGASTAAKGADAAATQFKDLSSQANQDWQNTTAKVQGQYQGSTAAAGQLAGREPGKQEGAWSWLQNQYKAPTASQGMASQINATTSGPSATEQQYKQTQQQFQAPGAGALNNTTSQQRLGGVTNQQNYANNTLGSLANPGATQTAANRVQPQYQRAGQAEQFATQYGGAAVQPGMLQSNAQGLAGQMTSAGALAGLNPEMAKTHIGSELAVRGLGTQTNDATQTVDRSYNPNLELKRTGAEAAGEFRNANAVAGFAGGPGSALSEQGMYEKFAQQAMDGNNPHYDRLSREGMAKINQQAAAKGRFTAGGTLKGLAEYQGALDAENFKNLAGIVQGGQGMQLQRLGQGLGQAQAVTGEQMGRGAAMQGLGESTTGMRIAEREQAAGQAARVAGLQLSAAQSADATRLQQAGMQADIAGQQDSQRLAGLQAGANTMGNADSLRLQGLGLGSSIAGQAQNATMGRLGADVATGQATDQANLARTGMGQQIAQGADMGNVAATQALTGAAGLGSSEALARQGMLQQGAGQVDSQQLAELGLGLNAAGQTDQMRLAGAAGLQGAAAGSDASERQRMIDSYSAQFGVDSAQAASILQSAGLFAPLQYNLAGSGINAAANAAALRGQAQDAATAANWQLGGMLAGYATGMPVGGLGAQATQPRFT